MPESLKGKSDEYRLAMMEDTMACPACSNKATSVIDYPTSLDEPILMGHYCASCRHFIETP